MHRLPAAQRAAAPHSKKCPTNATAAWPEGQNATGSAAGRTLLVERFEPLREEMPGVEWSGRCFGMELHAAHRERAMAKTFVRAVVEIDHRGFEFGRQARPIDGIPVIVGGDE